VVKQMSDDSATEKTGSAENRDEPASAGCAVHRRMDGDAGPHSVGGGALPAARNRRAHKEVERGGKVGTVIVEPQR
jgi:hypothetical protein